MNCRPTAGYRASDEPLCVAGRCHSGHDSKGCNSRESGLAPVLPAAVGARRYPLGMPDWESVIHAVQVALSGDRSEGRGLLEACWASTGSEDHAKRCVLAHYLADVQDTLEDEIRWDETALRDYQLVDDGDLAPVGIPSAAGLAPSLHLNLGDGYFRRGDFSAARQELDAGLACVGALGDDGYSAMIRKGLSGLEDRLSEHGA